MPVTTKYQIPYPDGTSKYTPLQDWFAGIANGVESAISTGLGGAPRLAFSDTERNTIYPAPVQGNLVMRPDKGYIEEYYDLYNSGTNPGGAPIAGWYPTGQRKVAVPTPTAGANITLSNNKLFIRDGSMIGSIDWAKTTALAHADVILTMPLGYRPESEYHLSGAFGPAPTLAGVYLVFRTDGVISALQPPGTRTSGTISLNVPLPV